MAKTERWRACVLVACRLLLQNAQNEMGNSKMLYKTPKNFDTPAHAAGVGVQN